MSFEFTLIQIGILLSLISDFKIVYRIIECINSRVAVCSENADTGNFREFRPALFLLYLDLEKFYHCYYIVYFQLIY